MTVTPDEHARSAAASLRRPLIVVGLAVLIGVIPFLPGLVGSLILYAITRRLHRRLMKLVPPRVSAVAITIGVFCLLLIPGTWLVSTIASEASGAFRNLRAEDVAAWLASTPFAGSDVTKEIAGSAPVLGSALVWLPGVVVLLLTRHFGGAALLAVLGGGLASNLDNLVRPLVYRRVLGVHPMVTLVGAFAGVRTLGVIGAFIGPLVLSCFVELLGVYEDAGIVAGSIGPRHPSPLESQHV
jgi:predicted PurR-regulated permease PerM